MFQRKVHLNLEWRVGATQRFKMEKKVTDRESWTVRVSQGQIMLESQYLDIRLVVCPLQWRWWWNLTSHWNVFLKQSVHSPHESWNIHNPWKHADLHVSVYSVKIVNFKSNLNTASSKVRIVFPWPCSVRFNSSE